MPREHAFPRESGAESLLLFRASRVPGAHTSKALSRRILWKGTTDRRMTRTRASRLPALIPQSHPNSSKNKANDKEYAPGIAWPSNSMADNNSQVQETEEST
jgi:hypothetical protein